LHDELTASDTAAPGRSGAAFVATALVQEQERVVFPLVFPHAQGDGSDLSCKLVMTVLIERTYSKLLGQSIRVPCEIMAIVQTPWAYKAYPSIRY
jgi:hypothetical protein